MKKNKKILFLFIFLLNFETLTFASVADGVGFGSKAISLGGAFTAISDDFSATFYNPAGLTLPEESVLTISPLYSSPELWWRKPSSNKKEIYNPPTNGIAMGIVAPVGKLFNFPQLSLGISFYTPYSTLVNTYVPYRNDIPYFPMYRDYREEAMFITALGVEILPSLSIGISIDFSFDLFAETIIIYRTEKFHNEESLLDIRINRELTVNPSLNAGILFKPFDFITIGFSYRGKRSVTTDAPNEFYMQGFEKPLYDVPLEYFNLFTPTTLTLGLGVYPFSKLMLSLDISYMEWSQFKDGHGKKPSPSFNDIFVIKSGIEYKITDYLFIRGGYSFYPSPVPEQNGETNFLDGNRNTISTGFEIDFRKIEKLKKIPISIITHFQAEILSERKMKKKNELLEDIDKSTEGKQISNIGYPEFSFGGYVIGGGASINFYF